MEVQTQKGNIERNTKKELSAQFDAAAWPNGITAEPNEADARQNYKGKKLELKLSLTRDVLLTRGERADLSLLKRHHVTRMRHRLEP